MFREEVEEKETNLKTDFLAVEEEEIVDEARAVVIVYKDTSGDNGGFQILLVRNKAPLGGEDDRVHILPGGAINQGESPQKALAREMEEELGVDLDPESLDPPFTHFAYDNEFSKNGVERASNTCFSLRADEQYHDLTDLPQVNEVAEAVWVSPQEALGKLRWSSQRRAVEEWLERIHHQ